MTTAYDALDRIVSVTREGASDPEDLTTQFSGGGGSCTVHCDTSGANVRVKCGCIPPPIFYRCKGGKQDKPDGTWPDNPYCR